MATTGSANPADRAYPFAGIVGMADLKLALLLNAVSPAIGGVLVRGEKGTAKSTMVRGLAALLPPVRVVSGCPYSCDPAAPDPGCPAGPHVGTMTDPMTGLTTAVGHGNARSPWPSSRWGPPRTGWPARSTSSAC